MENIHTISDAEYKAEALTFQRVFLMLTLLKEDFSFIVLGKDEVLRKIEKGFGKNSNRYKNAKEWFDAHSFGFNAVVNTDRRMKASIKSRERNIVLHRDLTSERIKDLHALLDTIMEVDDIASLTKIINIGLQNAKDDAKQII